jgi:hypothetical protein
MKDTKDRLKQCLCGKPFYVSYYLFYMRDLCGKCVEKVQQQNEKLKII